MRIDNYKSRLDLLKTLENFTYNYSKLHPKDKGASVADFENYQTARRTIFALRNPKKKDLLLNITDDLVASRVVGGSANIFNFSKKMELLDKNLYLLKNSSDSSVEQIAESEKRVKDNKEFLTSLCEKRLSRVESRLLDGESGEFLVREYARGLRVLNKKAEPSLKPLLDSFKTKPRFDKSMKNKRVVKKVSAVDLSYMRD